MHKKSVFSLAILVLLALGMWTSATPAQAANHGSITLDGYSPGWIVFTFSAAGVNDEDGFDNDFVAVAILDGNCNPVAFVPWTVPVTHPHHIDTIGISQPLPPAVGPITVVLYDTRGLVGNYEDLRKRDRIMDAASSDPEFHGCRR